MKFRILFTLSMIQLFMLAAMLTEFKKLTEKYYFPKGVTETQQTQIEPLPVLPKELT